ncbi:MAG: hypothetical protein MZV64_36595 [Ignavibacteriales bacterium]|nr:hypothetical protein [Ignavibacteriales bacterium]
MVVRALHIPVLVASAIYELSYDDIFAQQPYVDKTYAKENIDSVLFRTKFSNPYSHQFTAYLIHANSDSTQLDSLNLLDDGLHGDSLANDGLYGVSIPPRQTEDYFILGVNAIDNQTNEYYNTPDLCRFTTAGPVELDSISVTQLSALFYRVNPFLKNKSSSVTITNASVSLLCNDPWIISIQPDLLEIPDIPPGGVVSNSTGFTVRVDTSLYQDYFNLEFNVMKDEWVYWIDSMRYPQITGVEEELKPWNFSLEQNYPNPFNPSTKISWQLSEGSNVTLKIFNTIGEEKYLHLLIMNIKMRANILHYSLLILHCQAEFISIN